MNESRVPEVVAASELPSEALATFLAQELEHWGFGVERSGNALKVKLPNERELYFCIGETWVGVSEV